MDRNVQAAAGLQPAACSLQPAACSLQIAAGYALLALLRSA
jgi:hypothetical protein